MPNGGSDCCGTCWFNRSLEGKGGSSNFNRDIPSYCEIRNLELSDPFYTYCANHPYHRPGKDPIPIGPVFIGEGRSIWKQSPDTEEIRQHLFNIVSGVESRDDEGYHFYSAPAHIHALDQHIKWGEQRVIDALKAPSQYLELKGVRKS